MTEADVKRISELREVLDSRKQAIRDIEDMLKTPGWKIISSLIEGQLRARRVESFENDMNTFDSIIKGVKDRGAIAGFQLAVNAPKLALDDLLADVALAQEELDDLESQS